MSVAQDIIEIIWLNRRCIEPRGIFLQGKIWATLFWTSKEGRVLLGVHWDCLTNLFLYELGLDSDGKMIGTWKWITRVENNWNVILEQLSEYCIHFDPRYSQVVICSTTGSPKFIVPVSAIFSWKELTFHKGSLARPTSKSVYSEGAGWSRIH